MRAKFPLLFILLLTAMACTYGQPPQVMNYQAVVRDAAGLPLTSGAVVSCRFLIHDTTANGPVVFQEMVSLTTNQFGLITHGIGSNGNLNVVNWGTGPKWLQILIDPAGGSNFADMGTTQLLSVPYALFAGNASGATGPQGVTGSTGVNGTNGTNGINGTNGVDGAIGATGPQGLQGVTGANGANGTNGVDGSTGPQGLPGATGNNGANGLNGATGATGNNGADGVTGGQGLQGATGNNGANGLNGITGATGFQGPAGVNGLTGSTGPQGSQGPTGINGANGVDGTNGIDGATGATGAQGISGNNGADGAIGATGPQGTAGTNGTNGATGPQGLQGVTGVDGTNGIDGTNGTTGVTGPQGLQGATGANGVDGTNGIDGTNGTTGVTGPQGLQGATGANGVDGTNGIDGTNGATGATGPQGLQGATGANGNNGTNGIDGTNGATGATGPQGLQGTTGANGNNGTNGIDGTNGAAGATGPQGAEGATGANGTNGTNGIDGTTGPQGLQGPTGAIGATGVQGVTGTNGVDGTNGTNGVDGATGPQGIAGNNGTNGAVGATGLQGSQGATGPQGVQGATGANGTNGTNGIDGMTGPEGFQGPTGAIGATGVQGATGGNGTNGANGVDGATGPQGIAGNNGTNGAVGATGLQGSQGATGPQGVQGATGANGTNGTNGIDGTTGPEGLQGPTGAIGATGVQGVTGTNGVDGTNGTNGVDGATGPQGIAGNNGTNGAVGATGLQGSQGATGPQGVQGATGANGTNGTNGIDGTTGPQGLQGPTGAIGATGVQGVTGTNGVDGTNGTNGIDGATGAQGIAGSNGTNGAVGATGATGPQGLQGATGANGNNGTNGIDGTNGATGATGPQGLQGATGANGTNGLTGATGLQGSAGVVGATGATGNGAFTITTADFVQPAAFANVTVSVANTDWLVVNNFIFIANAGTYNVSAVLSATQVSLTNLGGDDVTPGTIITAGQQMGAAGVPGGPGASGATGAQGATGNNGTNGINGSTGSTGVAGPTGAQGATGATGIQGLTGATGAIGATGTGVAGPTGATGSVQVTSNVLAFSNDTLTSIINGISSNPVVVSASGANIYNTNGLLTSNRVVTMGADTMTFNSTTGNLIFNPSGTGNMGVGTITPAQKLDVAGTIKATGFQMPTGAATGAVLTSDSVGNGAWIQSPFSAVTASIAGTDNGCATPLGIVPNCSPAGEVISGSYLYSADQANYFRVYNISAPASTVQIAQIQTNIGGWSVILNGNYAYEGGYGNKVAIVNISNPVAPVLTTLLTVGNDPTSLAISGNILYVCEYSDGDVRAYDISNPAAPVLINTIHSLSAPLGMAISGHYLYVCDYGTSKFFVYDITSVNSITLAASVSTSGQPGAVAISGSNAYVVSYDSRLTAYDISAPLPVKLGSVSTGGSSVNLTIVGHYAYVPTGSNNLEIYDISTPAAPVLNSTAPTTQYPYGVAASGSYAYVGCQNDMQIFGLQCTGSVAVGINPVTGAVTPASENIAQNDVPKSNGTMLVNSQIIDNGTGVSIGPGNPVYRLSVEQSSATDGIIVQNSTGGPGSTANFYFGTYPDAVSGVSHPQARITAIDDGHYSGSITLGTKVPGADADTIAERMRISSTGLVGIGTFTPAQLLDVAGTAQAAKFTSPALQLTTGAASGSVLTSDASGNASWVTPASIDYNIYSSNGTLAASRTVSLDTANLMFSSTKGNLTFNATGGGEMGVGTTSPLYKIHIVDSSNTEGLTVQNVTGAGAGMANIFLDSHANVTAGVSHPGARITGLDDGSNSTNITFATKVPGADATAPVERMRISSAGNVGIGTTTPANPLEVQLPGSSSGTYDQVWTPGVGGYSNDNVSQSFTAGLTGSLQSVTLYMQGENSNAAYAVTVTVSSGGTQIATSTLNFQPFGPDGSVANVFSFSSPPLIVAGNSYSINMSTYNPTVGAAVTSNIYPGGQYYDNTNGYTGWSLQFKTYVETSSAQGFIVHGGTGALSSGSLSGPGSRTLAADAYGNITATIAAGPSIYVSDGSLSGNRTVTMGNNNLTLSATSGNFIFNPSAFGKAGIGTTGPEYKLHLMNSSNSDGLMIQNTIGGGSGMANLFLATYSDVTQGVSRPGARISAIDDGSYSANLTFSTKVPGADANALTERMRISDAGNLGIGTTNPLSPINTGPYVRPDASGEIVALNSAAHESLINLISGQNADSAHIGGIYFSRSASQGDAHAQIAAIQGRQVGTGNLAGGELLFFTKPLNGGTGPNSAAMTITSGGGVDINAWASQNTSANGYANMGGVIMEWGTINYTSNLNVTVTLPLALTTVLSASATLIDGNGGSGGNVPPKIMYITASSFQIAGTQEFSGDNLSQVKWIIIGK